MSRRDNDRVGDELLLPKEAARLMRLSPKTLANWRSSYRGPAWVPEGDGPKAAVRYWRSDIIDWIESRLIDPSSDRETGWSR